MYISISFSRGSQQATRKAANLIQALIDDPEKDVSEILPNNVLAKSTLSRNHSEPPGIATSLSNNTRSHSISKSLNMPKTTSKVHTQRQISAPPLISTSLNPSHSQVLQPIQTKAPISSMEENRRQLARSIIKPNPIRPVTTSVSGSWTLNNTGKTDLIKNNRMNHSGGNCKTSGFVITSVVSATSTVSQNIKTTAARRLFTPATTVTESYAHKPLPQPIGSNRPRHSQTEPSLALSSTGVTDSITATLHSTLTSLLSQVATQRSPMIWNERPGRKESSTVVTSVSSSPISALNGVPSERFTSKELSQGSSQDSAFIGHSRTPSLSPTSNHSISPAPEERPHLNPIGSERGHKKPPGIPRIPDLTSLMEGIL